MSEIIPIGGLEPQEPGRSLVARAEQHEATLIRDLDGAYLGVLTDRQGWNAGYKDYHEEPVEEAGLVFGVGQASHGPTWVYAKPLEGYTVEALNPDASSRKTMWRGGDSVTVNTDWGKDLNVPLEQWAHTNFGNPGTRAGIVRVTDPEGEVKHYLMGAEFRGQPDSWHVKGRLVEVEPHPSLVLAPTSSRELLVAGVAQVNNDPSLIAGNLVDRFKIDAQVLTDLRVAFGRITPYIKILHAPDHIAEQAGQFARLSLELLQELAASRPDLLDGQEVGIDELGRTARHINKTSGTNAGFIHSIEDEDEARREYLTRVSEIVTGYRCWSENARDFSQIATKVLDILSASLVDDQMTVPADSDLARAVSEIITNDKEQTASIKARREEALKDTIFDPDWKREGIEYRVAIPGQIIAIDLNDVTPLLTGDQTYNAFYSGSKYQGSETSREGYTGPTLCILEIDGKKYALVDNREAKSRNQSGRRSKLGDTTTWDTRFDQQIKLLQIVDDTDNPRLGRKVESIDLDFEDYHRGNVEPIKDLTDRNERGYLSDTADTGVWLELSKEGILTIDGYNKKVGITSVQGVVKTETSSLPVLFPKTDVERQRAEELRKAAAEKRQAIVRWKEWIEAIQAGGGSVVRRRGYNLSSDPKYYRSQRYVATVDEEGNIWGDFDYTRSEIGITGQPLAPGRYIIMKNPTQ